MSTSGYIAYPAVLKQATLWHNLISNRTSSPWPSKDLLSASGVPLSIKTLDPCPSLEAPGDELPVGRVKEVHSVGSIGKVKFVPIARRQNPHYPHTGRQTPYTGIFQGASFGIVRISAFREPTPNRAVPIFGMGLKFLRDGVESASLMAASSEGQKSWNAFKNSWSNHIPAHDQSMLTLTSGASPHSLQVGLSDWARYGENGRPIADTEINYPYKLVFRFTLINIFVK